MIKDNINNFRNAIAGDPDIHEIVLELIKDYSQRILDIGAGRGNLTERLIEQGCREIYACDKNPGYFKIKDLVCNRCDLNCEPLPYSEGFFDAAVCTELIEHLENPRHLLREIFRVLRPNGRVIISTPNNLSLRSRLSFLFRGYSPYFKKLDCEEETPHITMLTRLDLLRIFKETGFKLMRIIYTKGKIPKTHMHWQAIMPFLGGELFADTVIFLAEKL